jgi:hypothetical protein
MLIDAALTYAREMGWVEAREMLTVDKPRVVADADLCALHARIAALELVIAGVLGAARMEPPCIENLEDALATAGEILANGS